jgi:UDP-N-acetylglucosamine 2-epimerase (non-hydrolysing)
MTDTLQKSSRQSENSGKRILFVFGTRPEAIKLAPVITAFKDAGIWDVKICVTAQHREMLDQVLAFFEIIPDYDLNLMKKNQTLFDITADSLKSLEPVLRDANPDIVFVQGDTTSAFVGALAGYYRQVKIAHVEAGLRSNDKYSPFPEEMNRVLAGRLADYHFAPTERAAANLRAEGITKDVVVVGNTVVDALLMGMDIISKRGEDAYRTFFNFIDFSKRIILVTGHRRESFGRPFENICSALSELTTRFDDIEIVYPVHLNPNVREPVNRIMGNRNRIHLIEPLEYPYLLWLMNRSYLIITDSGGIQEEAPSLGKPVLVMRDVTERTEGIDAGTARLVGTEKENILANAEELLTNTEIYSKMSQAINPYGDGNASKMIVNTMEGLTHA